MKDSIFEGTGYSFVFIPDSSEYRQLARDREELEDIHKSRMDRVKAREESLLGRVLSKEKVVLCNSS